MNFEYNMSLKSQNILYLVSTRFNLKSFKFLKFSGKELTSRPPFSRVYAFEFVL